MIKGHQESDNSKKTKYFCKLLARTLMKTKTATGDSLNGNQFKIKRNQESGNDCALGIFAENGYTLFPEQLSLVILSHFLLFSEALTNSLNSALNFKSNKLRPLSGETISIFRKNIKEGAGAQG